MTRVILVRGKMATGKTAMSTALATRLGAVLFCKDDIYDTVAEAIPTHEGRNLASFSLLRRLIATNTGCTPTIIVDAPFHHLDDLREFAVWVRGRGARFQSILCTCSDERLWAERLHRRQADPQPNNLITDFHEMKAHYGDLGDEPAEGELVLDAIHPLDELVAAAMAYLQAP